MTVAAVFIYMSEKNLKDQVYDAILESIYASEYHANEILTESSLIKRFGFSKSPVREALTALCHEGVLRNIPRCGYQVISLTSEDIAQIQEYRFVLESGMLRRGASSMDEAHFRRLEDLDRLCHMETPDVMDHWMHNLNFHQALVEPSGNVYACTQLRAAMMVLWRAYAQIHWNKQKDYSFLNDMKYHREIIQALRDGNTDLAVDFLKKDFDDFGTGD